MIYAWILVVVNSAGVASFSPPVNSIIDCNLLKHAAMSSSTAEITTQCVRIELPKGK